MDLKRLRSTLKSSADDFLASAAKIDPRSAKSALKTLIWGTPSTSDLPASLPPALHLRISKAVDSVRQSVDSGGAVGDESPFSSPPTKQPRRSSRNRNAEGEDGGCDDRCGSLLKNLQIYAYVVRFCVSHPKKLFAPWAMLPSVRCLHDGLILYEADPGLMADVAGLCEEWWKEGLVEKETVVPQSFPFLLAKSLQSDKKVDMHRVYALREALNLFDFNDESIVDLKHLLVRCAVTSMYLKLEEGRRFISYLFGLDGQLAKEIFAVMRAQIAFGKRSILEGFGDILFRAWKGSEGSLREEIEDNFLQGLIESAIYAKTSQLAASIRRVLGGFISQRTVDGVVKLLFRLVDPVLFRSLQVANGNVRQNALHILLDVFPLEDPDTTREAKDTLLERQFFLLDKLLIDDCPGVRVVAVEGACRIIRLFWEVIPPITITKLLSEIVDDMAHDICYEVRLSTLKGMIYLLENPQSHEVLKVLLPRLGHMFSDSVLSVRVAVADLLLAVRGLLNFQFTKVVGSDALLSSLASDNASVAKRITKLLIPSYFPSKIEANEACIRCVALIKRSPAAGARFCEYALSEGSSPGHLMELSRVCANLPLSLKSLHKDQVDGLLQAAANLCQSLAVENITKARLSEFFTADKLTCLLTSISSSSAQTSILRIASVVSPENVVKLLDNCVDLITDCGGLYESVQRQEEVRIVHRLFTTCGRFNDLFEILTHLLHDVAFRCQFKSGLELSSQSVKRKKAKATMNSHMRFKKFNGKKNVSPDEDYAIAAGVAWQIKDLLAAADTRKAILDSSLLEMAFSALKFLSQLNIENYASSESLDVSPVLAYINLALHMSVQESNHQIDTARLLDEEITLNVTLAHLFVCTNKIFIPADSAENHMPKEEKRGSTRQSKRREVQQDASNNPEDATKQVEEVDEGKKIHHVVKLAALVLKFVADSASMKLASNYEMSLQFASAYFRFTISKLERSAERNFVFTDLDLRDIFICLKSSITYAAKLLQIVLTSSMETSPPLPQMSDLTNDLLDLIFWIELSFGFKQASLVVTVVKPWLPDILLALGSCHLFRSTRQGKHSPVVGSSSDCCIPAWLVGLGKDQLHELGEEEETVNEQNPLLRKLVDMATASLKSGNPRILDAVGVTVLKTAKAALEIEEFGLFLGLLHIVCVKLVGSEYRNWEELELISASLEDVYNLVARYIQESTNQDGRYKLEKAKALLESAQADHE